MASSVRTGGLTALLLVFAVVLAAGAVPMLSGHSPLEAAGPDSSPEVDGLDAESEEFDAADDPQDVDALDDVEAGEGLIHEDFASLADDEGLDETMTGLAGLLALLFGADGLEGAVGEPTDLQESELDAEDPEREDRAESDDEQVDEEEFDDADSDERQEDDDSEAVDEEADDTPTEGDNGDEASEDGTDEDEAGENGADEDEAGEDPQPDDELAGADSDERTDDESDDDASDDEAAGSDTDEGVDESESLLDRLDPLRVGLLVGGLVALVVGWVAYRTGRGLVSIVLSVPTLIVGAVTRFVFGITAVVERAIGAVRAASSVLALPGLFAGAVVQSCRDLAASVSSLFDREQPTTAGGDVDQLQSEREQIRAAWRAVIETVDSQRYRRRTPGEIKQRAVEHGLPEPPLSTLVGVFRDVEYGAKDPTERAPSAVSAANELRESTNETDDPTDTEDGQ